MAKYQSPELVFIPIPSMGHLLPTVEIAQRLTARGISTAIVIMKFPFTDGKTESYIQSLKSHQPTTNSNLPITLLELPPPSLDNPPDVNSGSFLSLFMDAYKPVIRQALLDRYGAVAAASSPRPLPRLAGLVLDMFCTSMTDVADELGSPSYIFFTFNALLLSLMFCFESLHVDIPAVYGGRSLDETVEVAGFENPIPIKVWPAIFLDRNGGAEQMNRHTSRFRRAKGIMVNTFMELEASIIRALSITSQKHGGDYIPPIYPVGPILNMQDDSINSEKNRTIMRWLDSQPPSSVVFLCFGSRGSFHKNQVKEIAAALDRSGKRFLWSLRRRPEKTREGSGSTSLVPDEYEDLREVLPEGFLDRTAGVGRVIGWAPQVAVLAHRAVGAFVSHCGWNSTLESLWFGVPILAWPMDAEQQTNAFALVKELGLAVEIRMDYKCDFKGDDGANMMVAAEEIEEAITKMMEGEDGERVRKKVKEVSVWAKKAVSDAGGSSNQSMGHFVEDVLRNMAA